MAEFRMKHGEIENLAGKTVTFIPTAALPDKLDFHMRGGSEIYVMRYPDEV